MKKKTIFFSSTEHILVKSYSKKDQILVYFDRQCTFHIIMKFINHIALHYNLNAAHKKTFFNKITNRKIALIINFILFLYSFTIFFSFSPTLFFICYFFSLLLLFFLSLFLFFYSSFIIFFPFSYIIFLFPFSSIFCFLVIADGYLRTNMPIYFEQDIYCLAAGHHDSVLVRDMLFASFLYLFISFYSR